jgi:hypothetical protein
VVIQIAPARWFARTASFVGQTIRPPVGSFTKPDREMILPASDNRLSLSPENKRSSSDDSTSGNIRQVSSTITTSVSTVISFFPEDFGFGFAFAAASALAA